MKTLITILILLSAFEIAPAQVTQEWVARYNGPDNLIDEASSMVVDNSGNVYVTGKSNGSSAETDYVTIKYNSVGVESWVRRYNGVGNSRDEATSIAVDNSGNVYVSGFSIGNGNIYNYVTIKYNSVGIEQWVALYKYGDQYPSYIALDNSGNIYVTFSGILGGRRFVTIKYNSSGDSLWVSRNANGDYPRSMKIDGLGNVYVTGTNLSDYVTVKYNTNGIEQWVAINEVENQLEDPSSLVLDNLGNVYVTGTSYNTSGGFNYDILTIKYNSAGIRQWFKKYIGPGNGNDIGRSLALDNYGNVLVAGSIGQSFATIVYSNNGVLAGVMFYTGPENLQGGAYSIAVDGSGNSYVTGHIRNNVSLSDYCTVKYDVFGSQQWVKIYNGPSNDDDQATSIALDNTGNVYITGKSNGNGTNNGYDYATIKYSQSVGINQISSGVPDQFNLSQNYPNPFNPNTKINFEISKTTRTKLYVFDLLGKVIVNLVDKDIQPGIYEVEFDGSKFSSGIYFYRIVTEFYSETKKMSLIK